MAEFNLWLLIVGIAAGAAVMWLVIGTLARRDDELDATEREVEAGWIARTIEEYGGRAPVELVEQILALHRRYLQGGPGIPLPQGEPDHVADATVEPEPASGPGLTETAGGVEGPDVPAIEPKRAGRGRPRTTSSTTEAKAR
jgi:hypothetical protein